MSRWRYVRPLARTVAVRTGWGNKEQRVEKAVNPVGSSPLGKRQRAQQPHLFPTPIPTAPPGDETTVLPSEPRPAMDGPPPGGEGSTPGSGGSVFLPRRTAASSPSRRSGMGGRGAEGPAWVSVTDVKPSHWYNVRHRFSWRVGGGGGSSFGHVEEVQNDILRMSCVFRTELWYHV